jgi:inosose dehydratase
MSAGTAVPAAPLLGGRVAAAPITWGVCEVPGWGRVLPVDTVLSEMAQLGLAATELGPPGFLPDRPDELRALLARHRLRLVGGFLAVALHDAAAGADTIAEAERTCRQLAACGADVLVLAAATGLDGYDERPALSDGQWHRLVHTAARIRDLAGEHGLRVTLHPHVGTHVEQRAEVERFLADSDLPLCLDTGHLLIGGTEPLELVRAHPGRIAHVHLKDVDLAVAGRVRAGELTYTQGVRAGLYVPLGDGDVAVDAIVTTLERSGYAGWYVLEQDTALPGSDPRSPTDEGDPGVEEPAVEDAPVDAGPRQDTARSLARLAAIATALDPTA